MKVKAIETPVGDRHVSEAMRLHKSILGGEQSGHIILGRHLPSGDGLLTALHVLCALKEERKSMSVMASVMKKFPQVLVNVSVKEKRPIAQMASVQKKINDVERLLKGQGRLLVRYSGTEPLLRIMIEGPDKKKLDKYAADIVSEVRSAMTENA